jgi:enoyl-CoA hydratase/carnithine racemase
MGNSFVGVNMDQHVMVARDGAVLCVTLARPEKKNALTNSMYAALIEEFARASRDETIGALVLRGEGGAFTAGNDLTDFLAAASNPAAFQAGRFLHALVKFEKPLIAAVEGAAVGIGCTLCFHCDLVYAAPSARFQMPFVNLGLVPEAGSSLLAPQLFGRAKAAEYLLLGEPFGAAEALRLGLVNEVLEPRELYSHAIAKGKALAAKPRSALMVTRSLLRGDTAVLTARIDEELKLFAQALSSSEARNAFSAFLQKSKI